MKYYTLIDANSFGHRFNQMRKLSAGDQETQAIFGTLRAVRDQIVEWQNYRTMMLWDGRSWRFGELPDYKAKRTSTKSQRDDRATYVDQAKIIREIMTTLGIIQISASNMEADDLAGIMVSKYSKRGDKIRLVTTDGDWLQLVRNKVVWDNHRDKSRVRASNFEERTGYETPRQFLESKALLGDTSDNIKGVQGIGAGRAKTLIDCWGSVPGFLNDMDPETTFKAHTGKKLPKPFAEFHVDVERQETFERNIHLMNLIDVQYLPKVEGLRIVDQPVDKEAFRDICKRLAFHSILNDFDQFVSAFVEAKERTNDVSS